jgi:hypothetical protein
MEVIHTITLFMNGIKAKTPESMRALVVPSGSVRRTNINPAHHTDITLSELVSYIGEATAKENIEGIWDPDNAIIKVDDDLAIVWTPWQSLKDGEPAFKGSMAFILTREKVIGGVGDGKWLICGNADNMKKVG